MHALLPAPDPPYHRLALTHRLGPYAGWRPVVELVVVGTLSFGFMMAFMFAVAGLLYLADYPLPASGDVFELPESDPALKLVLYGGLGAMLPAPFIAARVTGRRPRALWSADNRFRWGLFGRAALIVAAFLITTSLIDATLSPTISLPHPNEHTLAVLLVVAVFTPLQCAAEEVVFRGALPQIFGAWVRQPWLGYLPSIPIFVVGHDYDPAGLFLIGLFAVFASVMVHRTGGLEVAIAFHIGNNLSVEWYEMVGLAEVDILERPSMILLSELSTWVLFGILLAVFWNYAPPGPDPAPQQARHARHARRDLPPYQAQLAAQQAAQQFPPQPQIPPPSPMPPPPQPLRQVTQEKPGRHRRPEGSPWPY